MKFARIAAIGMLGVGLVTLLSGTARAGVLNGHANAYNDGVNPTWTGSTAFSSGTLTGFVDYAVFAPGDFPFGGGGYTPTAGELVYAYQVFVTGAASVSSFSVALENPTANNIGSFNNIGTDNPTTAFIIPICRITTDMSP